MMVDWDRDFFKTGYEGFESPDHLVYLVSDLDKRQNLNLLASLAPPVHALLGRLEG